MIRPPILSRFNASDKLLPLKGKSAELFTGFSFARTHTGVLAMAHKTPTTVISHWNKFIENLEASPMEFYASVEQAIQKRQVPDTKTSRVDWREGGAFSARREYLRVAREKLVFDVCGAPFGTGFFFSWWLAELTPSPVWPTLIAIGVMFLLFFVFLFLIYNLGFFGLFFFFVLFFLLLWVMVTSITGGEAEWVEYVLVIPLVGPLLERLFRPLTYYRMDTALMYQSIVHAAVMEVVDEMIQRKGIRALTELERKPVLREFFHGRWG
jgi:hypothetical protein